MTLGEAYIKDILRPPPVGCVPANVAHPFQSSFYTYLTKRAVPKHWFLAAGFTFTLVMYSQLDNLREAGKQKNYDQAVMEGKKPCKCMIRLIIKCPCRFPCTQSLWRGLCFIQYALYKYKLLVIVHIITTILPRMSPCCHRFTRICNVAAFAVTAGGH